MTKAKKTGIQQYMLREHFKTEQEALETLKRVKAVGFDSIELCGFLTEPNELLKGTPLEIKVIYDWPQLIRESGLEVAAFHELLEDMLADPDRFIGKAKDYGIDTMVAAAVFTTDFSSLDSVKKLVTDLNSLGQRFKEAGINLLYHNHNMEFARIHGTNSVGMDLIYRDTNPALVNAEMDAFWTQNSGANPAVWAEKLNGRLKYLHINDCGVPDDKPGVSIRPAVGRELGAGNMELDTIFAAAIKAGCEQIILETHDNWINNDPFQSMAISFKFLQEHYLNR